MCSISCFKCIILCIELSHFHQFNTQNSLIRAKSIFKAECKWYDAITRWPPKRNKNGGTEKGIKKFAATLAAVVMAFSCMTVSASAAETATYNNHDDTAFSFAFSDWGRSNTTGRSKTDTSGTYAVPEYASKMLEIYRDARKRLSRRFPEIENTLQSAPEFAAYRRTCCAIPSRPE